VVFLRARSQPFANAFYAANSAVERGTGEAGSLGHDDG
jgi:hypothetical protein